MEREPDVRSQSGVATVPVREGVNLNCPMVQPNGLHLGGVPEPRPTVEVVNKCGQVFGNLEVRAANI